MAASATVRDKAGTARRFYKHKTEVSCSCPGRGPDNTPLDKAPETSAMNAVAVITISSVLLVGGPGGGTQPPVLSSSTKKLATQKLSYRQARHLLMRAGLVGRLSRLPSFNRWGWMGQ